MPDRSDQYRFGSKDLLTAEALNKRVLDINSRLLGVEIERLSEDEAFRLVLDRVLQRSESVIASLRDQLVAITELSWLTGHSATPRTLAVEAEFFLIIEEENRALFSPGPFAVLTRAATPNDYAVVRTLGWVRDTGRWDVRVESFTGAPGPHSDWQATAIAGSTLSQLALLAEAKADRQAVETSAEDVADNRQAVDLATAQVEDWRADVANKHAAVVAAATVVTRAEDAGDFAQEQGAAAALVVDAAPELLAARDETVALFGASATLLPVLLAPESGYVWGLTDPATNRTPVRCSTAGRFEMDAVGLPPGAIGSAELADSILDLIPVLLPPETGYVWGLTDPVTRRTPVRVTVGGVFEADAMILAPSSVGLAQLQSDVLALVPTVLSPDTGYVWGLTDPVTKRSPVRCRVDGCLELDNVVLPAAIVAPGNLNAAVSRQALPQVSDVGPIAPDPWRLRTADIGALSPAGDGSAWKGMPSRLAKLLLGPNLSGVSIEVRRSAGLVIVGRDLDGSYNPGSYPSTNYRGYLLNAAVSNPTGTHAAGDYYLYAEGSAAVSTGTFAGMTVGDALVYDGSAWHIQTAPGAIASRVSGQFWNVTAAGTFDGISLAIGDRILYLGRQTGGGGFQFERWYKVDLVKGDYVYAGEFAPSGGLPAAPLDGEVYQASASGTAGGFTFAANDYLVRVAGVWGVIPNEAAVSYASAAFMALKCQSEAAEWEFRRTDKSAAVVGFRLRAQVQSSPRRHVDKLWLVSDSMYGNGGVGDQIIAASGREGVRVSNGGSTSRQVLGMMEYELSRLGDRYEGRILVPWHGQNNQPGSEPNTVQIREVSLRMAQLAGAHWMRLLFLSVLGQRNHSWSGSRIVVSQHEGQFTGSGDLHELNQWYEAMFPGQWLSPLAILRAAATDAPDPTFPGMTEKQVAATYGIAPWSFFGVTGATWTTAQLNYQGTRATAGLPTGGADLDYFLRIGGGTVGNILVKEAGTWVERGIDITHLSAAGGAAMATGGAGFDLGGGYTPIPAHPGVAGYLNNNFI